MEHPIRSNQSKTVPYWVLRGVFQVTLQVVILQDEVIALH
jgi:hypothetical protein